MHSYKKIFFLWWEVLRPTLLATFNMPCSIINYIMQHITFSVLFYHWKFVPFDSPSLFFPSLTISDNQQSVLYVYELVLFGCGGGCFLDST